MPKGQFVRTEQHKENLRKALTGRVVSDETKRRISEAKMGKTPRPRSPEAAERFREAMKAQRGKYVTSTTREKLKVFMEGQLPWKVARHGVTQEQWTAAKQAGQRWCWFRRHFAAQESFGNHGTCSQCKSEAYRKSDLKKKYNLTQEQYLEKLEQQGGGCAICGTKETGMRNKHLMIDHNHTSGTVRGLLCVSCNTAIERLETIPNWSILALQYLARFA